MDNLRHTNKLNWFPSESEVDHAGKNRLASSISPKFSNRPSQWRPPAVQDPYGLSNSSVLEPSRFQAPAAWWNFGGEDRAGLAMWSLGIYGWLRMIVCWCVLWYIMIMIWQQPLQHSAATYAYNLMYPMWVQCIYQSQPGVWTPFKRVFLKVGKPPSRRKTSGWSAQNGSPQFF